MRTLAEFLRSLRRAPRSLRTTPAITAASVATLAIAIGATTAIFSVWYGVVLRPLPFHEPDALVQIDGRAKGGRLLGISQVEFDDWAAQTSQFVSIALYGFSPFTLSGAGDPEVLRGAIVSSRFFALLAAPMRLGRGLSEMDDAAPHVVIGEPLWRLRFGGDPGIVGRAVVLNGQPYTVVGVAPRTLRFPADDVSVWTPLGYARTTSPPAWKMRGFRQFSLVGRLKDARAIAAARREADGIAATLATAYPPSNADVGAAVTPLGERLTGAVRPALQLLVAAVTLVLLVACANLANLQLARAAGRQRDMAVRRAAGATDGQLLAHALADSVVLGGAGALLGLGVAKAALVAMLGLMPSDAPRLGDVRLDLAPLAFTCAVTLICVAVCGAWPAAWSARRPAVEALRQVRHGGGPSRVRDGVVVAEIALAVVLLVGSALLGRSLYALLDSGSGASHEDAVTLRLNLEPASSPSRAAELSGRLDRLLDGVRQVPGVRAVGLASSLPPNVSQMRTSLAVGDGTRDLSVEIVAATGGVFSALGIPLLAGRTFTDADTADASPVLVLSRAVAARFFPDGDAIGRPFRAFSSDRDVPTPVVVGIVGDVKFAGLEAPPDGALYVPHTQRRFRTQYLVVRTDAADGSAVPAIRGVIRAVDPSLAVSDVRSVRDLVTAATARPRLQTSVLVLFALVALGLALVGVYGVVTHVVGQRMSELAVRVALGASQAEILGMVLGKAARLCVLGTATGAVLATAAARAIAGFLYGVGPLDWPSFVVPVVAAVTLGLAAALGPAVRAARVNPAASLRVG